MSASGTPLLAASESFKFEPESVESKLEKATVLPRQATCGGAAAGVAEGKHGKQLQHMQQQSRF